MFMKFSFEQLDKAFRWVSAHFLEFGLGGNRAWHGAALTMASHLRGRGKQPISADFERKLKTNYILRIR